MWVGRAGDDLYVRSAHGQNNPWFRRAKASGAGRIRARGLERDVVFTEPDPGVHAAIEAAYHAKYDRYGPGIVGTVVGPEAEAVTISSCHVHQAPSSPTRSCEQRRGLQGRQVLRRSQLYCAD